MVYDWLLLTEYDFSNAIEEFVLFWKIYPVGKRWRWQICCRMRMKWYYLLNVELFLALKGFLSKNQKVSSFWKKNRKLTQKGFFQKQSAILFLEKHLFRSWSCLAAVSFVSAILHKATKIIHANDGSSYPLFAILSTFGRSSFMFGKQLWIPTFSLLDTWKAVLSILTETLLPQVPKRFANSRNFSSKSGKIYRKKIFGKVRCFQIVPLKPYNAVLKKSVENVTQNSEKIKMYLFARKNYISLQEVSFDKTKIFLRKASINSEEIFQGTGARKNCRC